MDYQNIIDNLYQKIKAEPIKGKVASYIPELSKINPEKFAINLLTVDNQSFSAGEANEKFSIQSISKVLTLVMAYSFEEENLWSRVGVEPPGTPFNSLLQLEADLGIPRNPLINAGALVICDILVGHLKNPKDDFLGFVRKLANSNEIYYNQSVIQSEKDTCFRNAALINLMRSFGNIKNDIYEVLEFYIFTCSVDMNVIELAQTFSFLANYGLEPISQTRVISSSKSKRINAVMQLCGFYDEAGEFSFKVGLPGKSGVGGGIVAILPNKYSIAVWSPPLNEKGNSERGLDFLEQFTTMTEESVF